MKINEDKTLVKVKYLDDEENDDPIEYDVDHFFANANPAPCHLIDLTDVATSVALEQPVFVHQERGELIPLQRRQETKSETWINRQRTFDETWGDTIDMSGESIIHIVPKCIISQRIVNSIVPNSILQCCNTREMDC